MAMSAKERKQKQIERERLQLKSMDDSTYPFLEKPFFQYLETNGNWMSVTLALELMGFEPPEFENDLGPEHFANEDAMPPNEPLEDVFPGHRGSVGRAEVMMSCLLDAAVELSGIINAYKKRELAKRRAEIEAADLPTKEARKQAFDTIAHIAAMEAELDKNVRRTFPQWQVKGV